MLDLQHFIGCSAQRLTDPVTVLGPPLQRLRDEQIECPLQQFDAVW